MATMQTTGTPTQPEPSPRRALLALALALWALLAWGGALGPGGAAFDDVEGVLENPLVNGERPLAAAFSSDYWHHLGDAGHYRPLALVSLALDHALFGDWLPGYHLSGVLLHAAVVLLAALLLLRLAARTRPGVPWAWLLGLGLVASLPVQADAVAWISARSSPLAILPGLAAGLVLAHLPPSGSRRWARGCTLLLALAGLLGCLLGKEDGFLGIVPLAAGLWARGGSDLRGRAGAAGLGCLVALLLYGWLRFRIYGSPLPSAPHAPLADLSLGSRLLVGGRVHLAALGAALDPLGGSPSHGSHPWAEPRWLLESGILGWLLWLGLLDHARRSRASGIARAGLVAALLAWVPFQGWVPAGEVYADRFLYLPLLFAAPWLGEVLGGPLGRLLAAPERRRLGLTVLGLALLGLLTATWRRAPVYGSLAAYHEAVLDEYPRDPTAWNGLGLALELRGDEAGATQAWRRALEVDPTYGRPHSNLGRVLLAAGEERAALSHFESAARLGAGNPVAWANLGNLRGRLGLHAEAEAAYRRATELAPGMATAWRGLVQALLAQERESRASAALERARALEPGAPALEQLERELERLRAP
jgi:Flp pilus assembly protein TadD